MGTSEPQRFSPIHLIAPDFTANGERGKLAWKVSARDPVLDAEVRGSLYGALFDRLRRYTGIPVQENGSPEPVPTIVTYCDVRWEEDETSMGIGVELRSMRDPAHRYYSFASFKGPYVLRLMGLFESISSAGDYLGELCMAEVVESLRGV